MRTLLTLVWKTGINALTVAGICIILWMVLLAVDRMVGSML